MNKLFLKSANAPWAFREEVLKLGHVFLPETFPDDWLGGEVLLFCFTFKTCPFVTFIDSLVEASALLLLLPPNIRGTPSCCVVVTFCFRGLSGGAKVEVDVLFPVGSSSPLLLLRFGSPSVIPVLIF